MNQGFPADTNGDFGYYGVIEDMMLHFWLTLT